MLTKVKSYTTGPTELGLLEAYEATADTDAVSRR